jgi:ribonuclease BN (tRNA processing enzyme)
MELIVIGAGPAYTSRRGAAGSSYLLRSGSDALLLDLGHGAFSNLASEVEPSSLGAILVSHLHPDHFVDLVPLRHYLKWEFDPPRRATVMGPVGLANRLDALNGNPDFAAASLDIDELSEGVQRIGPFEVEARRVAHTSDSFAFRVSAVPNGSG